MLGYKREMLARREREREKFEPEMKNWHWDLFFRSLRTLSSLISDVNSCLPSTFIRDIWALRLRICCSDIIQARRPDSRLSSIVTATHSYQIWLSCFWNRNYSPARIHPQYHAPMVGTIAASIPSEQPSRTNTSQQGTTNHSFKMTITTTT